MNALSFATVFQLNAPGWCRVQNGVLRCVNGRRASYSFGIEFIVIPIRRVAFDVLADLIVMSEVVNDGVVVSGLPGEFGFELAGFSGNGSLKAADEGRQIFRLTAKFLKTIQLFLGGIILIGVNRNDAMKMIWHYYKWAKS